MTPKELEMKSLVEMSGKMVFLDKLLPRLMETQQKVLVFSQMTRALDVIEDYLLWKGSYTIIIRVMILQSFHCRYKYERLDGNVSGTQRQEAIDRFNDTSSQSSHGASNKEMPWIFLLSTRAGGVGINLTAANVVVIYDSDWNPQNDMQAQARYVMMMMSLIMYVVARSVGSLLQMPSYWSEEGSEGVSFNNER